MKNRRNKKTPSVKKTSGSNSRLPKKSALQPEAAIVNLAKKGQLAKAGQQALKSSFKKGLTVTILIDDQIFRLSPDGSRELIKKVAPPPQKNIQPVNIVLPDGPSSYNSRS